MTLTGKHLIGSDHCFSGKETFKAVNPATGALLDPLFHEGAEADVDRAARLAERDFDSYRQTDPQQRGRFLDAIAEEILALGDVLIQRACDETGLLPGRIEAERGRTCNQLKLFAQRIREGHYAGPRIDRGQPERTPLPKPDMRMMHIPLGPVAVFGASNFPLAFSVAGGDTASALAAGCPVVVKGHPAHPGTSELVGRAIQQAVVKCAMPEGCFCLVQGCSIEVGATLVTHPLIKAVAFTGSLQGGRALFDLASCRPEPIPVYAEMGSVNPVFLLPQALGERGATIARGWVESVSLGVGQFCTNPGLVFAVCGPGLDAFLQEAGACLAETAPGTMLSPAIKDNYWQRVSSLASLEGVEILGPVGLRPEAGCLAAPVLLKTEARYLASHPEILEEVFGPSSVCVVCDSESEMVEAARTLPGQLTATVHAGEGEIETCRELFFLLERKAGRLLFNGFPTGVEVCDSMAHGGPYPASTDGRTTSVGTAAIDRFLRPVCYQNFPQALLAQPLIDGNGRQLWRMIDGVLTRDEV